MFLALFCTPSSAVLALVCRNPDAFWWPSSSKWSTESSFQFSWDQGPWTTSTSGWSRRATSSATTSPLTRPLRTSSPQLPSGTTLLSFNFFYPSTSFILQLLLSFNFFYPSTSFILQLLLSINFFYPSIFLILQLFYPSTFLSLNFFYL